jgi:hypothetical protein
LNQGRINQHHALDSRGFVQNARSHEQLAPESLQNKDQTNESHGYSAKPTRHHARERWMKITQAVGGFFILLREGCFWKFPQQFPLLVRYLIYF